MVGSTKTTGLTVVTESVKVTGVIGVSEALEIAGGLDAVAAWLAIWTTDRREVVLGLCWGWRGVDAAWPSHGGWLEGDCLRGIGPDEELNWGPCTLYGDLVDF